MPSSRLRHLWLLNLSRWGMFEGAALPVRALLHGMQRSSRLLAGRTAVGCSWMPHPLPCAPGHRHRVAQVVRLGKAARVELAALQQTLVIGLSQLCSK